MLESHPAGAAASPLQLPQLHKDDAARDLAQLWYSEHLAEHLTCDSAVAVKRCAAFLFNEGLSTARANTLALQAFGAMQQGDCRAFIDIDRSTSHVVFLVDPESKRELAITAADLALLAHTIHNSMPAPTRPA